MTPAFFQEFKVHQRSDVQEKKTKYLLVLIRLLALALALLVPQASLEGAEVRVKREPVGSLPMLQIVLKLPDLLRKFGRAKVDVVLGGKTSRRRHTDIKLTKWRLVLG